MIGQRRRGRDRRVTSGGGRKPSTHPAETMQSVLTSTTSPGADIVSSSFTFLTKPTFVRWRK